VRSQHCADFSQGGQVYDVNVYFLSDVRWLQWICDVVVFWPWTAIYVQVSAQIKSSDQLLLKFKMKHILENNFRERGTIHCAVWVENSSLRRDSSISL
jgi:hypothetical protein